MKQNPIITKTIKDDAQDLLLEPEVETKETEDQPQIETPLTDLPQKPTLPYRKQEASKPLYLKRYE